jgi:CRP/FNR family transcriptional regulator
VAIIQNFALRSVRSRLARLLLDRAAIVEACGSLPPLTQEEMAHHLGSVREVIGRTLRGLADEGLITTHRRQIVVLDRERLQKEAER